MSTLEASQLDAASRSDLIARAEALGIDKADVLTRAELVDEIVKRTVTDPAERRHARGLLGMARDLVARVVERGLHLPDAAAFIRGLQQVTLTPVTPPIATVTLAEIYAKQRHRARALAVLDEVLAKEPDHAAAKALRDRIAGMREENGAASAPLEGPAEGETGDDARRAADAAPDLEHDHDRDRDVDSPLAVDPDVEPDTVRHPSRDSATRVATYVPQPVRYAEAPAPLTGEAAQTIAQPRATPGHEVGQLVVVAVDGTSAFAQWELGETALAEVRARTEGGELILRVVAVTPRWDEPHLEIRDVEVAVPAGEWWVCDLPVGAVLRGAIGWRGEGGFEPLAVALEVIAPNEGRSAELEVSPQDFGSGVERRIGIEERARRRAEQGRAARRPRSSWEALAFAPWEAPYEPARPANIETR